MTVKTRPKDCSCDCNAKPSKPRSGSSASVDEIFRAFSDRTRLRILHLLLKGEMCVGDMVTILETTQPRASQHLSNLRHAGLVTVRKAGLWSYYSLTRPATPVHAKLLECLKHCFAEVPELQADQQRAAEVQRQGRCCDNHSDR